MTRSSKGGSTHESQCWRTHGTQEEICIVCSRIGSSYTEAPNFRYDSSSDTHCMEENRLPSACQWYSWSAGNHSNSYLNCCRNCLPCCSPRKRSLVNLTLMICSLTKLAMSYWSTLLTAHLLAPSSYQRLYSTASNVHFQLQLSQAQSRCAYGSQSLRYLQYAFKLLEYLPGLPEISQFMPCQHYLKLFWMHFSLSSADISWGRLLVPDSPPV